MKYSIVVLIFLSLFISCSKEGSSSQAEAFKPQLEEIGLPDQRGLPPDQLGDSFPFQILNQRYVWGPFSEELNRGLSISSGWGYMTPLIAVRGKEQYSLLYFACDPLVKNFYCFYLMKNGDTVSELHAMGLHLLPEGGASSSAYQTPMIFLAGDELLIAYSVLLDNGKSLINLISINLNDKVPYQWQHRSSFFNESGTLNYLGGAMGPEGSIFIAGLNTDNSQSSKLEIVKISPPYRNWEKKKVIRTFDSPEQVPVYPHVQVRKNGFIEVLVSLHNNVPCNQSGEVYSESYKTVVSYHGSYESRFDESFKVSSADVKSSSVGGDSCLFQSQRFAVAQFYDSRKDIIYSLLKTSEVNEPEAIDRVDSNNRFKRTFQLYANNKLIVSDLSSKFSSYFADLNAIWSMNGTILSNGQIIISAANDGLINPYNDIALIMSEDFSRFSDVFLVHAPDRPGHSVHFALPDKNGSTEIDLLHLVFSGTIYEGINLHHRYNYFIFQPRTITEDAARF